jgi:hypothetical protein
MGLCTSMYRTKMLTDAVVGELHLDGHQTLVCAYSHCFLVYTRMVTDYLTGTVCLCTRSSVQGECLHEDRCRRLVRYESMELTGNVAVHKPYCGQFLHTFLQ